MDILPSVLGTTPPRLDPTVWPWDTHHDSRHRITVGGVALEDIADQYGTPAYVLDEADVRRRCAAYRHAFPDAEVAYAGKALMIRAVAKWVTDEGLAVDVCSGGELAVAISAGVEPKRIIMHGNAKSATEIRTAVQLGVGRIVVDSAPEIALLACSGTARQNVLIRMTTGIDIRGHRAINTGVVDQKFGFPVDTQQADNIVKAVVGQRRLNLVGLHCHIGSQVGDVAHYAEAVRRMIAAMAKIRRDHGVLLTELDLGGGHAVPYRSGDVGLDPATLAAALDDALDEGCDRFRFPRPKIVLEPGRAIVARAGVTVYRVASVKHVDGGRTFVSVDGGMGDNPRVGLYDARYDAALANRRPIGPFTIATVAGRYCEAGDEIARAVQLPVDVHPGDVIAVPCTGAYHHSLSSSYNTVCRPPIVAVRRGVARELIRRETIDDLLARETGT